MTRGEFEQLVALALDSLPEKFVRELDNVEVVVEDWPTRQDLTSTHAGPHTTLFGLYRGVAKTKRTNYTNVLPDKISIFAGPILSYFGDNPDIVKAEVRKVVLHEVGHHLGMSEEDIRRAQKS
jgi:predicted Zn-dependent protease with MMP-like domain